MTDSDFIMPEEPFKVFLTQISLRSTRFAEPFAFVVIRSESQTPQLPELYAMGSFAHEVIRQSDVIGVLDNRTLGVVLQDVQPENTDSITARIRKNLKGKSDGSEITVIPVGDEGPTLSGLFSQGEPLGFTDLIMTYIMPNETLRYLLEVEWSRAVRKKTYFSLILIHPDLPYLSGPALSSIARLVRVQIRLTDTLGGLGDKQFALILPQAVAQNLPNIAERIRGGVKTDPYLRKQIESGHTMRIGTACFPTHAETPNDLLRAAGHS